MNQLLVVKVTKFVDIRFGLVNLVYYLLVIRIDHLISVEFSERLKFLDELKFFLHVSFMALQLTLVNGVAFPPTDILGGKFVSFLIETTSWLINILEVIIRSLSC